MAASPEVRSETRACRADALPCCQVGTREEAVKPVPPSFGVQIWPSDLAKAPASVERLVALHPRHLRFSLNPNWHRQPPLRREMSDAELDASIERGFGEGRLDAQIAFLNDIRRRTGADLHLVIWEPPPLPGETAASKTRSLDTANVTLAARFFVGALRHIQAQGLTLAATELSNEPDGDWNIRIAPADYLALLQAVRQEGKRRGVALPRIHGPGTSTIAALRAFLRQATATAILDAVDVVSVHGWDNPQKADPFAELEGLYADFKRLGRKPELAMTEYGIARPVPADPSDRMNVKKRVPDGISETPFFASISARDLLRFYARGIGTIIYWEFQDQSWGTASFGLLDTAGKEKPIYQVMRAVSGPLALDRPERIGAIGDGRLTVMQGTRQARLFAANPSDGDLDVALGSHQPAAGLAGLDCRGRADEPGFSVPARSLRSVPIRTP